MQQKNTISDLSCLGLVKISGENAKKFLQGQLTCNLDEISFSQTRLGAHCNPQGRIISLFRIFMHQDSYYLQLPREMVPIAITALKKYAVFFKVELTDASDAFTTIGYCGTQLTSMKDNEKTEESALIILNIPGNRYVILGDQANVLAFQQTLAAPVENNWKQLDIANTIPTIYPATSEKFLPHDINLPALNGVSFNKGCYTGQEIIARMQYRAKIKTTLCAVKATSAITPQYGDDIYSQAKPCGNIIDCYQLSYNNYELLVTTSAEDMSLDLNNMIKLEKIG